MATNIPQDDFQKTALRLPKDLHARIHAAAAETGRSYNAEIVMRLQASFAPAQAQDMFSTPDFQHRLKEQTLHERIQLTNGQVLTLQMHINLLHLRMQALGKEGEQGGLFDAREQLADAEQNLTLLLAQREALLLESQQLDREYQDAVRPLNAKAAAMTEELLEPERRAVEDKLRQSNERLGKLKPTRAEIDAAVDAEVVKNRQVLQAIAGRGGTDTTNDRARTSTTAVTTGADEVPYKVVAPAKKKSAGARPKK